MIHVGPIDEIYRSDMVAGPVGSAEKAYPVVLGREGVAWGMNVEAARSGC